MLNRISTRTLWILTGAIMVGAAAVGIAGRTRPHEGTVPGWRITRFGEPRKQPTPERPVPPPEPVPPVRSVTPPTSERADSSPAIRPETPRRQVQVRKASPAIQRVQPAAAPQVESVAALEERMKAYLSESRSSQPVNTEARGETRKGGGGEN